MRKMILLAGMVALLPACSSTATHHTAESEPDKVLARIDDLDSRPDWVKESEPFRIQGGQVISLGMTTLPASGHRVEAGYRIAQNNAKAAIAGAIEQRISFAFQGAEEGTGIDSTQARYIGAEASELTSNSIRLGKVYWEKVATTQDSGERVTQFKVFSTVTMPEEEFRRAIHSAIAKAQGKGGLSQDFAKKVDEHWDRFVNAAQAQSTQAQETDQAQARKPASVSGDPKE